MGLPSGMASSRSWPWRKLAVLMYANRWPSGDHPARGRKARMNQPSTSVLSLCGKIQ